MIESVLPGPKTKTKKRMQTKMKMKRSSAEKGMKGSELAKSEVVYCLPTTEVDAATHEMAKSGAVYSLAFGNQPIRQYLSELERQHAKDMHVSRGRLTMPVASDSSLPLCQPITSHRHNMQLEFPAITNASQREAISNYMTALPGIARMHQESNYYHFGWQPSPFDERNSARLNSYEHKKSNTIYESQELDVSDSEIYSMWMGCKGQEKP